MLRTILQDVPTFHSLQTPIMPPRSQQQYAFMKIVNKQHPKTQRETTGGSDSLSF